MLIAITTIAILTQRSPAEIENRRNMSASFSPVQERMMRAGDGQLILIAESKKIEERRAAVAEIVDRRLKGAAMDLTQHLKSTSKPDLLVITIDGLGRLGNRVAIPSLRRTLQSKSNPVRIASAFSLGWLGDKASAPSMRKVLPLADELSQRKLVLLLGKLGDKGAEPHVRALLANGRYQGLRASSAEVLGMIGNVKDSPKALIEALHDDYPNVRAAAANSLAKLGARQAIPALKVALKQTSPQASNAPGMEARSKEAISRAIETLAAR